MRDLHLEKCSSKRGENYNFLYQCNKYLIFKVTPFHLHPFFQLCSAPLQSSTYLLLNHILIPFFLFPTSLSHTRVCCFWPNGLKLLRYPFSPWRGIIYEWLILLEPFKIDFTGPTRPMFFTGKPIQNYKFTRFCIGFPVKNMGLVGIVKSILKGSKCINQSYIMPLHVEKG